MTTRPSEQDTPLSAFIPKKRLESSSSGLEGPIPKKQKCPNQIPPKASPFARPSTPSAPPKAKQKSPVAQKLPIPHKLLAPPMSTTPATVSHPERQLVFTPTSHLSPRSPESMNPSPWPSGKSIHPHTSKKFLDPRKTAPSGHLIPHGPQNTVTSINAAPSPITPADSSPTLYLGLSELPVPVLSQIGMPPSISDRKRVGPWSVILSGISDTERRSCILVSRMFRYAGKSMFCSAYLGYLICALR